ncbi:serine/threonine-protein kinase [Gordonia liuliyuniae]|uniref:non-specific serine/threonine protein kinase n=1 Tax=Gordonia liuliyuniae TaxID=2911517 RepID=A0ABS9IY26_9ACTN|nr:serine/threonine-protein kinase [Gordonia liuliyuniae]MCF8590476.1 serine/threonine protein kinase [Gordonia liuliyuniae]
MTSPDMSLGPYRLVRLLGRGGMGEVYEAVDTVKDRTVALKLLPAHLADDAEYRARFLRESRTVARLNDPHVIPIHDFGEIDGRLYLDMRIVHGRDLRSILRGGPVPTDRAVDIVGQIAGALDAAHASGLLHRDVKPENILVDDNGFAYLVDFGIAQAAGATRLTQTGAAIGSFAYMAPERFADSVSLTPAADVYSLACVLFEAVTGSPPYAATSIEQIISGHLTRPVAPTGTVLDPVIAAGTAKSPAQRVQTCGAFAAAARDALAGRYTPTLPAPVRDFSPPPTAPPQAPPPPPPGRTDGGHVALVAAIVVLVVALVAGVVWFAIDSSGDDSPDTVADVSTQPAENSRVTTTVTEAQQTPDTKARETTRETTETSRAVGDLGLSTPISTPPCDGRTVTIVYSATAPGAYAREVGDTLARYPGSKYLRTDQSCASLRRSSDGNPIYAVYFEGSSLADTCATAAQYSGSNSRRLDDVTAVGVEIC